MVERDPLDPGLASQQDAYAEPMRAKQAALDAWTAYAATENETFGPDGDSGTIGQSIDGKVAIREAAVRLDHEGEIAANRELVATTADRMIEEAAAGEAASAEAARLTQQVPDRQEQVEASGARLAVAENDIANGTLVQRLQMKIRLWHLFVLWLFEMAAAARA